MKKKDIINYMLEELKELRTEYEGIKKEYETSSHMERIGLALQLEKKEDKYYYFWTVCNDLGITQD